MQQVITKEYDKLVQKRIELAKLLEKIDKQLANLRGKLNGKY